jgi:secretion/DNA translocation related TadE-like protein
VTKEDGSTTVLMLAVVAVLAAVAVATAGLGMAVAARAQAQSAADASALAAAPATYPPATDGIPLMAARRAAGANGARLVSCRCQVDSSLSPRVVTVVVAVAVAVPVLGSFEVQVASRAEFDPLRWLGT